MSKFKPTYILNILHIIHYKLSVGDILNLGLEYSQIAELISEVIQDGYVEDLGESGLKLTQSGTELLLKLNKELYPNNSAKWILPLEENRIPKIGKFDIYLPQKKNTGQ